MVFLTGDVHHRSMKTRELKYILPSSEVDLALKYVRIASSHNLNVTLFITGKCFIEEREKLCELISYNNLEIGGHTFNGFKPLFLHRISKLLNRSYWFSYKHQLSDVKMAINAIMEATGISIKSWRTHSYAYDLNTPNILKKEGIMNWSDVVDYSCEKPYRNTTGILCLPVNTIEDHENLIHGYRTNSWFAGQNRMHRLFLRRIKNFLLKRDSSPISSRGLNAGQWLEMVCSQVTDKIINNGMAVLNIHPVCMYLLDDFSTFEKLCKFISRYNTFKVKDAGNIICV